MDADYIFNIPFDFEKISISFEEIMKDVFSDDIAEKLFTNEGEFIICADEVVVQLGGINSQADVKLEVTAAIYNENELPIQVDIQGSALTNGTNPMEIITTITKEDTEKNEESQTYRFQL